MEKAELEGRVALVTGAGKGLGQAIAQALAGQGASVACQDVTPVNVEETVRRIRSQGGVARDYIFALTKKMPVQALIEQVVSDWGSLDILVNNFRVKPRADLLKMDEWDWHQALDVNLGGAFLSMQSAARVMQDLGGGVIVNLAALPGGDSVEAGFSAYYASMAGIIELTRQVGRELQAAGIRVNAVASRGVDDISATPGSMEGFPGRDDSIELDLQSRIVAAALDLCLPGRTHPTGEVIVVEAVEGEG